MQEELNRIWWQGTLVHLPQRLQIELSDLSSPKNQNEQPRTLNTFSVGSLGVAASRCSLRLCEQFILKDYYMYNESYM